MTEEGDSNRCDDGLGWRDDAAAGMSAKLLAGTELFNRLRGTNVQIATTPKDLMWQQDSVSLYRFRPLA